MTLNTVSDWTILMSSAHVINKRKKKRKLRNAGVPGRSYSMLKHSVMEIIAMPMADTSLSYGS